MKEKRKNTRVRYCCEAVLSSGTKTVSGKVRDLSLKGMYLESDNSIETYEKIEIFIQQSMQNLPSTVELSGVVSRNDNGGLGVQFENMSIESFKTLKEMVRNNHTDPEKIDREAELFKISGACL